MTFYLGIDGGGTGCRAAITDASGQIIGQGAGGPANISVQTQTACANILDATRQAMTQAGMGDAGALIAVLGLAGANVTAAANLLRAMLPFRQTRIVTDAVTSVAGALGSADGIVAAMGTGSVFAVQIAGQVRQYGGRGFLLGDEGSGAVLGRALLSEALRAEDGFAPMSPLLRDILTELGGIEGVISFGLHAKPAEFGAFAPRLLTSDDPAARRLLDGAVAEIGAMIDHLQGGRELPVVFLGGLGAYYADRFQGRWPIRGALGSGLDGALFLARQAG